MHVLRAREQLEMIAIVATAFGSLPEDSRSKLLDSLRESADQPREPKGKDLSKLAPEQVQAIFAQFGIPVLMK